MIRRNKTGQDDAGFPIVSWTETRAIGAPEGPGTARVECRILKDADGNLLFVARGSKRKGYGTFEEGKPWAALKGFSIPSASSLYYTAAELQLRKQASQKSLGAKLALHDGAHVLWAEFHGDSPIHINYTDAPPADLQLLHFELSRAFMDRRQKLVDELCTKSDIFTWPRDDARVANYDPGRTTWPDQQPKSRLQVWLEWAVAISVVGTMAIAIMWMLGFISR